MNIENKVIAITGAAQGLGFAMAEHFASKGAKLALIDVNSQQLEHAKSQLENYGTAIKTYQTNVTNEQQVEDTFANIRQDFGSLNVLVNNAGIVRDAMLLKVKEGKVTDKMSLKQWQSVIDINLTGVFLCGREAASQMVETNQPGVIINISSISRGGNIGQSNYTAAKAGVSNMTVTWAKELARYNIRVAAIAPGFMATEMTESMPPEAIERVSKAVPLRRLGTPQEIASTAVFIIENDYVSGRTLEVDGGLRV